MATGIEGQLKVRDERHVNARKVRGNRKGEKALVLQGPMEPSPAFVYLQRSRADNHRRIVNRAGTSLAERSIAMSGKQRKAELAAGARASANTSGPDFAQAKQL